MCRVHRFDNSLKERNVNPCENNKIGILFNDKAPQIELLDF